MAQQITEMKDPKIQQIVEFTLRQRVWEIQKEASRL